jgi:hypothetical protein
MSKRAPSIVKTASSNPRMARMGYPSMRITSLLKKKEMRGAA